MTIAQGWQPLSLLMALAFAAWGPTAVAQTVAELTEQLQMAREAQQQWQASRDQLAALIEENQAAIAERARLNARINELEAQRERDNAQISGLRLELLRSWETRSTLLEALRALSPKQAEQFVADLANDPGLQGAEAELATLRDQVAALGRERDAAVAQRAAVEQQFAAAKAAADAQIAALTQQVNAKRSEDRQLTAAQQQERAALQRELQAAQVQQAAQQLQITQLRSELAAAQAEGQRLAALTAAPSAPPVVPVDSAPVAVVTAPTPVVVAAPPTPTTEETAAGETPVGETPVVPRTIQVQRGDTLSRIAARELGAASQWQAIFDANRGVLKSPNSLRVGMELVLPTPP